MSDAYITATAATPFGRHPDRTLVDLAAAAGHDALETAGMPVGAVDAPPPWTNRSRCSGNR